MPKKTWYETYLASRLWATIRKRVLLRDNYRCRACDRTAEVVHHKSYSQPVLDGKADEHLVSLCHACHTAIEFTVSEDKKVKNGLRKANQKLAKMIASLAQ